MNTHRFPLSELPTFLPLYPCPYGCGAQLGVSSRTADGERGRCGACRGRTVFRGGQLVTRLSDDVAQLGLGMARAMQAFKKAVCDMLETLKRLTTDTTDAPRHRMRRLTQPRTLHAALAINPRPARLYLDARPARTPATRRR